MTRSAGDEHDADVARLQTEIEQTRHQLEETVDALTAKVDVKQWAQPYLNRVRHAVVDEEDQPRPEVIGLAAVAAVGVVTLAIVRMARR